MSEAAGKRKRIKRTATDTVLEWERMPDEVHEGIEALRDKKVEDIRVYDMRGFTPFCDFVIIGTVLSSAQAKVAKVAITEVMEKSGLKLYGVEGEDDSSWLLIDFWDVVVHLFRPETRKYYSLETLWADLPWWPGSVE
jgi:ribosome-associated protein